MPWVACASRIRRTVFPIRFGSTSRLGANRVGKRSRASSADSLPRPTSPSATPLRSMASTVSATGSFPSSDRSGTSLNMYPAGKAIVWLSASVAMARRLA